MLKYILSFFAPFSFALYQNEPTVNNGSKWVPAAVIVVGQLKAETRWELSKTFDQFNWAHCPNSRSINLQQMKI